MTSPVYPVRGTVQKYGWGKFSSDSVVAAMYRPFGEIDPTATYAEIWFGTHVNGPSQIIDGGKAVPLSQFLASKAPEYTDGLPYLLKVLSIRTALSIQAHPDANLAQILHQALPDLYRDPNHKPELAIALTPMDVMVSFRPVPEIVKFLQMVPEFRRLVGEEAASKFIAAASNFDAPLCDYQYDLPPELKDALRSLFQSLMEADPILVCEQLSLLLERLPSTVTQEASAKWSYLSEQIQTIAKSYPGDVGIFAAFMLNVLRLAPGEAIFLGENEPHAYLHGDCVECMATSDNVVRAGLTPKFKDVNTLVRMLTYKCGKPKIYGQPVHACSIASHVSYTPPVEEFLVERFLVPPGKDTLCHNQSPTMLLCLQGDNGSIEPVSTPEMTTTGSPLPVSLGTALFSYETCDLRIFNRDTQQPLEIFKATLPQKLSPSASTQ